MGVPGQPRQSAAQEVDVQQRRSGLGTALYDALGDLTLVRVSFPVSEVFNLCVSLGRALSRLLCVGPELQGPTRQLSAGAAETGQYAHK